VDAARSRAITQFFYDTSVFSEVSRSLALLRQSRTPIVPGILPSPLSQVLRFAPGAARVFRTAGRPLQAVWTMILNAAFEFARQRGDRSRSQERSAGSA